MLNFAFVTFFVRRVFGKLWKLLNSEAYINTLGSLSGNQAVQHAKAGRKRQTGKKTHQLCYSSNIHN